MRPMPISPISCLFAIAPLLVFCLVSSAATPGVARAVSGPADSPPSPRTEWTQFGGPGRDFGSTASEARSAKHREGAPPTPIEWGEAGPKLLWHRPLAAGYSGIVTGEMPSSAASHRLYTLGREGDEELILAIDGATGSELWRFSYAAPTGLLLAVDKSYGDGPQATPLVATHADGEVLVGLGFTGVVTAVDTATGERRWSRDLLRQHGVAVPFFGHAASPIRVGETVVVLGGGARAFDLRTGELRWENDDFETSYASPIGIDAPDGPQLVIAGAGELVGLEPDTGRLLWRFEHRNQHQTFLSSPVAGPGGVVFASAYFLGSVGLRPGPAGALETLWKKEDLQVSQTNAVRFGGTIVASHNRQLVAVDLSSGDELWRQKGIGRSNLVRVDDDLLLLDDRGRLKIATVDRQGLRVRHAAPILDGRSWTAPTVLGDRLYARNGTSMVAVAWRQAATDRRHTLAAYLEPSAPVAGTSSAARTASTSAKAEPASVAFFDARDRAIEAVLSGDQAASKEAMDALAPWLEHSTLGAHAHYYRAFLDQQAAFVGPPAERLARTDAAVASARRAIELEPRYAEAHALLAGLYPSYYRLSPARGGVVGPLGDEHLARAVELAPDNPRVMAAQAHDLLYSPVQYGGDPEAGRALLERAVEQADREASDPNRDLRDPRPAWGPALLRYWAARAASAAGDRAEARRLATEALALRPELAAAHRLLDTSDPAQDDDSNRSSNRSR